MKKGIVSKAGAALAVGGILLSTVFVAPVQAQTIRDQIQTKVDQVINNRCDRVTARVDERINLYNQNKDAHIQRYENIKTTVTNLVNKLNTAGYDTAAVVANLQTLDQMIKDAASSYTTFIATLESSKSFACGNSEGQFRAAIAQSLTELKDFRGKTQTIIDFVHNTLRPSIQDLRNQKPAQKNS